MNNLTKMSTLAAAAVVIGFAVLFAPAKATTESDAVTIAAAGEVGYLPAQIQVSRSAKIEPMPATF